MHVHSGLMNEPHDLDVSEWAASLQYVVNELRSAGSENYLLLPGSSYSSAEAFPTEAGPYLVNITDPLGGTGKLLFDGKYCDDCRPLAVTELCPSPQVPRL